MANTAVAWHSVTLKYSWVSAFLLYGLSGVVAKGLQTITTMASMHSITPREIGLISLWYSCISGLSIACSLGLRQAYWLSFIHEPLEKRHQLACDVLLCFLVVNTPLLPVFFLGFYYFFKTAVSFTVLACIFLQVIALFIVELWYQVLIYTKQPKMHGISLIANTILMMVGFGCLTWCDYLSGISLFMLQTITISCIAIFAFYTTFSAILFSSIRVSLKRFSDFIVLGIPSLPSVIAYWLLNSTSRWQLAHYCSLEMVALYNLLDMAGMIFQLLILNPCGNSYVPWMLEQFKNSSDSATTKAKNRKLMWVVLGALSCVIVILWLLAPALIKKILPPFYLQAVAPALWYGCGHIFLLGTYFAFVHAHFLQRAWLTSGALVIAALIHFLLSFLLIPAWGISGATFSLMIGYGSYFLFSLFIDNYLD